MYITHSCVGIQYQVPLRRRLPQHERARAGRRNWSIEVAEFVDFVFGGLLVLATASLTTSGFSQVVKYLSDGCLIFRHAEVRYFQLGSARTRLQLTNFFGLLGLAHVGGAFDAGELDIESPRKSV